SSGEVRRGPSRPPPMRLAARGAAAGPALLRGRLFFLLLLDGLHLARGAGRRVLDRPELSPPPVHPPHPPPLSPPPAPPPPPPRPTPASWFPDSSTAGSRSRPLETASAGPSVS